MELFIYLCPWTSPRPPPEVEEAAGRGGAAAEHPSGCRGARAATPGEGRGGLGEGEGEGSVRGKVAGEGGGDPPGLCGNPRPRVGAGCSPVTPSRLSMLQATVKDTRWLGALHRRLYF